MNHAVSLVALVAILGVIIQAAQPGNDQSPIVGTWVANVSKSTLHPSYKFQNATVRFEVQGDKVLITDTVVDASGKEQSHGTTTFQTDGKEHPFDGTPLGTGVVSIAQWKVPSILETIVKKDGKEVTRLAYEVSSDTKTLTAKRSGMLEQTVVFDRK